MSEAPGRNPKISVICANYNHARYLRQSIEAVLTQTYGNFECIIVDDGSTDESWEIIEEYARKDPRVIAERFPQNRGVTAAFGRCAQLCSGELLFGRASDDYLVSPDFFQEAVDALNLYPDAAGAFAASQLVRGEDDTVYGDMGYRMGFQGGVTFEPGTFTFIPKEQAREEFLAYRFFVPGSSAIWKRKLFDDLGGYDTALGPQSDYFFNHALPMLTGVVQIHDFAVAMRVFPNSYSGTAGDDLFFRRHALVEKKIRATVKETGAMDWTVWREAIIKYRIPDIALVPPPAKVRKGIARFLERCLRFAARKLKPFIAPMLPDLKKQESEIARKRQHARTIFEEIVQKPDIL